MNVLLDVFEIGSNFIILLPIVILFNSRMVVYTIAWIIATISSLIYHLCRIDESNCFVSLDQVRSLDHLHASLLLIIGALTLVHFIEIIPVYIEIIIIVSSYIINLILVLVFWLKLIYVVHIVSVIYAITILITTPIYFVRRYSFENGVTRKMAFTKMINKIRSRKAFLFGFTIGIIGFLCFIITPFFDNDILYQILHSFWHLLTSIGYTIVVLAIKM